MLSGFNVCFFLLQAESAAVIKSISTPPKESSPEYINQRDICTLYFNGWAEQEQVAFIEHLLSRMCHYQHGQINSFLKPMLQRDFISALPGESVVHDIYYEILTGVRSFYGKGDGIVVFNLHLRMFENKTEGK